MYTLFFLLCIAATLFLAVRGIMKKRYLLIYLAGFLGIFTLFMSWFPGFWGEKLWFDHLGYNDRFWTVWGARILLFLGAFLGGGLLAMLLTSPTGKVHRIFPRASGILAGVISGLWWSSNWEVLLKFIHRADTGAAEPILGMDTGFYLFTYPFLETLYVNLLVISLISVGAAAGAYRLVLSGNISHGEDIGKMKLLAPVSLSLAILVLVLGFGRFIARYGMLYSEYGIVSGPGWTDVHVRLPMLTVMVALSVASGALLVFSAFRPAVAARWSGKRKSSLQRFMYMVAGVYAGIWVLVLGAVPAMFQWLKVEPNEITVEEPFLEHNIRFTRNGFHLNKVENFRFEVSEQMGRWVLEKHGDLLSNVRLWDYRALDEVFKQFQEIRLYYEFRDVDIDRYVLEDEYRQVMVSVREMQPGNLPVSSQTFVNRHFKYTHGYGAVLNRVNQFTEDGLPNLLLKDIPPRTSFPELEISRPEVYYGELTDHFVVVNSAEEEFDYPSGDQNMYAHYGGSGGVQISNFFRKLIYGYRYGGTRFLLSGYPTTDSRIMFHRAVRERAQRLAPFLTFDSDPYVVIAEGKIYWMMDAYTTSKFYPYSEPFSTFLSSPYAGGMTGRQLEGDNYIRNSVKVVIDAYNGDVDFFVFEKNDPLIQVYSEIFPGMFQAREEMPGALEKHIRYPVDMLLVQGLVYGKYHMTDPTVFYNQEDLWVRATEKYYNNVQPVEPYYIMWTPPGSGEMEFVLMLPFTPKNKQVMIGWIAGMCDPGDYGRFLAYQFPKEKRILGTQQVETKIDQDSYLSGQLTLWDQRGSQVIRGNVLAIPLENTLIYVEPIYLKSETSAYPELRLVAVMHDDRLSYAEDFETALQELFAGSQAGPEPMDEAMQENVQGMIRQAREAFDNYLRLMNEKQFEDAGMELNNLENALRNLEERHVER